MRRSLGLGVGSLFTWTPWKPGFPSSYWFWALPVLGGISSALLPVPGSSAISSSSCENDLQLSEHFGILPHLARRYQSTFCGDLNFKSSSIFLHGLWVSIVPISCFFKRKHNFYWLFGNCRSCTPNQPLTFYLPASWSCNLRGLSSSCVSIVLDSFSAKWTTI